MDCQRARARPVIDRVRWVRGWGVRDFTKFYTWIWNFAYLYTYVLSGYPRFVIRLDKTVTGLKYPYLFDVITHEIWPTDTHQHLIVKQQDAQKAPGSW